MNGTKHTTNIADAIVGDLRSQIFRGKLKAGERLMAERELATAYGTNRNTLREAVRKLEQARLVTVRHGRGVIVTDFRRCGSLDLLPSYLQSGPELAEVVQLVQDMLEPRILLMEYATRLAVARADATDVARLRELSDLLVTAFMAHDATVVAREFGRWIEALTDASHSVAVRWIANPFLEAFRGTLERFPMLWILEPSFPGHLRGVVEAIESHNERQALEVTREYYERVDSQLLRLLRVGIAWQARASAAAASAAV